MTDARFEDGAERPLNLAAQDADDLAVMSALVQDAVLPIRQMVWDRRLRRFAMLVNRFRWEDRDAAHTAGRAFERVQAMLVAGDVTGVQTQGIDRAAKDTILSVLSLAWTPGDDGTGTLVVTLAGDGAIAVTVEALEVTLRDVTRPYRAPSGQAPAHRD